MQDDNSAEKLRNTRDLVTVLGGRECAAKRIGCTVYAIDKWHSLGVPTRHWPVLIRLDQRITMDGLERISRAAKRRAA